MAKPAAEKEGGEKQLETENVEEAKKNSIEVTKATKLFKKKTKLRGWADGLVVKCLLPVHWDLNLGSQHPHRRLGVVLHSYNPSTGEGVGV